jgi:hypothetical protein
MLTHVGAQLSGQRAPGAQAVLPPPLPPSCRPPAPLHPRHTLLSSPAKHAGGPAARISCHTAGKLHMCEKSCPQRHALPEKLAKSHTLLHSGWPQGHTTLLLCCGEPITKPHQEAQYLPPRTSGSLLGCPSCTHRAGKEKGTQSAPEQSILEQQVSRACLHDGCRECRKSSSHPCCKSLSHIGRCAACAARAGHCISLPVQLQGHESDSPMQPRAATHLGGGQHSI